MSKKKCRIICLVIVFAMSFMLFAGCANEKSTSTEQTKSETSATTAETTIELVAEPGPFGKYTQPVEMNIGRINTPTTNLPEGDTMEDNLYLKAIKDRLNVDIKYSWFTDAATYEQKVNLVIASGDIPDVMYIGNQNQLNQLVEADMIEDLTQAYEETVSPYIKELYDSYGDRKFETAMFDNKLMAITDTNIGYQYGLLWVRKDWMDKVGAQTPKTLDDVINLAQTFIDKDPGGNGKGKTVGITCNTVVAGSYNNLNVLDPIFSIYKSYPRQWIRDISGNYIYGTIATETKRALAKVAEMYKDGIIDKEFAVRAAADVNTLLVSGTCGMMVGPWWMPYWPLNGTLGNNPNADWVPFAAPLDVNGNYNVPVQNAHTCWLVVKKGYEYPEAVVKVLNLQYQAMRLLDEELTELYKGMNVFWTVWPFPVAINYEDILLKAFDKLNNAWINKNPDSLDAENTNYYNSFIKENENPREDIAAWADWTGRYVAAGVMANNNSIVKFAPIVFPGITETMETKWANLGKLENEALLKIIFGEEPIDYFDMFVQQWKDQGGDEITREVNEALK